MIKYKRPLLWLISFAIVAFGQPAWIRELSPLASACGYALFWIGIRELSAKRTFWIASIWFCSVQLVQLSWLASTDFQGAYILFVYAALAGLLGLQFGAVSLFVAGSPSLHYLRLLACASCWTIIEWGRLFILCGFSWNPVGLSLSSYTSSLQLAAVGGVYLLSFWVMLTNLTALKAWTTKSYKQGVLFAALCLFPYAFGMVHQKYHSEAQAQHEGLLSVALVQTALLPSEKVPIRGKLHAFVSPLEQWDRILSVVKKEKAAAFDLMVLPEAALPFGAEAAVYPFAKAADLLKRRLGNEIEAHFPSLKFPYAEMKKGGAWFVSNAFFAQALANAYNATLIAGLDGCDPISKNNYNAAFQFVAGGETPVRYAKRVLLPLAEYLPFHWLKQWTKHYGITEFFIPGKEATVFHHKIPLSVSICYEETFAHLVREGRLNGACLLVNLTNDSYYPNTRLPEQHFSHAVLRAVENGVPLVRACNSGVTGGVDSLGRVVGVLQSADGETEWVKGVLSLRLNTYHYPTLFLKWGNGMILTVSFGLLIFFVLQSSFLFFKKSFRIFIKSVRFGKST